MFVFEGGNNSKVADSFRPGAMVHLKNFYDSWKDFPLRAEGRVFRPRKYRTATGSEVTRKLKAVFFLSRIDYEHAYIFEPLEMTLAKAVCNLRYFHKQTVEQTVKLIHDYFNHHTRIRWSNQTIERMWYDIEGYSPDLGLRDETAMARELVLEVEDEIAMFLGINTKLGGRSSVPALRQLFDAINPAMKVTKEAFGRAVKSITGEESHPSNGTRYYDGFHIQPERAI